MTMSLLAPFRDEIPTEMRFGRGAFGQTARLCRPLGLHALLVTGRGSMRRLGFAQQLCEELENERIGTAHCEGIPAGPTTEDIDRGAALCRDAGANLVVALGGGSVLDAAKAIATVAPGPWSAADYLHGRAAVDGTALPVVAIPTTSGTGSELNRSAIITDPEPRIKDGIRGDSLFPRLAIVDPELTCSLGRYQTAATGFDALAHAVESAVSPKSRPATDLLAFEAIRLVRRHLPRALADPDDLEAREGLAWASTTMGINLACVGTCFPHRADKALCALHPEISHGQSVALFYREWIAFSLRGNVRRFAEIARILAPETASMPDRAQAAGLAEIVGDLLSRIGLDRSMADLGVREQEIPDLVKRVVGDLSVNPVPVERQDLPYLFARVFHPEEALR